MGNGPFSLSKVLGRVSDEAASAAGMTAGQFLSLPREVPLNLTGEADSLGLALSCLISSAANSAGPVKLSVSVDRAANGSGATDGKVMLRFTVSDDGVGMTGEQAAEFLRVFTNADAPGAKGSAAGNGHLDGGGLVEALGGSIAVNNSPGRGFTVSFTAAFGLQDLPVPDVSTPAKTESVMPDGLENIRNARILLVEDHPVNQNLTRAVLEQAGCKVDLAEDGKQAVDAVRKAKAAYDAILMDVQMPVMDGFEATRLIRNKLRNNDVPIIAMTANVHGDERGLCIEAGMNDHVPKPIHIPDLYACLIRWTSPHGRTPADGGDSKPAADSRRTDVSLPKRIAGIDIDAGLARAMGNKGLYSELLEQFAVANAALGDDIAAAIGKDDLDKARFLVHGLSSTAGNLGADKLHSIATDLEKALIAHSKGTGGLFKTFRKQLDGVILAIAKSGISPPPAATRIGKGDAPFDTEKARQLVDTISAMLDDQDLGALEEVGKLLELMGGRGQDKQLAKFEASLNSLDFAKAGKILDGIAKEILD